MRIVFQEFSASSKNLFPCILLAYTVTPEEDPLSCSTGSRSRESPRNDNDAEEDAVTALLRDVPSEDDDDTDEEIVDIFSPSSGEI